jgi:hypothetical protein
MACLACLKRALWIAEKLGRKEKAEEFRRMIAEKEAQMAKASS